MKSFFSSFISSFLKEFKKAKQQSSDSNIGVAVDTDTHANYQSNGESKNHGFASESVTQLSLAGIDLIGNFEGLRLEAYHDSAGVCTIGYGTTVYPNGVPVQPNDQCTIEQARKFMHHDLARFEKAVSSAVKVPLTQNQFDALVSLTYNIGAGAFKNSTLLKLLNQGDYAGASNQFDVWIKAGGQTVQGLVNRRAVEKSYFLK